MNARSRAVDVSPVDESPRAGDAISTRRYAEYLDPRLAAVYDHFNALGADGDLFCALTDELAPSTIVDLGCGTGLLTRRLATGGRRVFGLDPAAPMLDVARSNPEAKAVRWMLGGPERLGELRANLVVMTSHVAQLFVDDAEWRAALRAIREALLPGGHLVFDSRNPLARGWEAWTAPASERTRQVPSVGDVSVWPEVTGVENARVRYEIHYRFHESGEHLVSYNELVFRTREEIERELIRAGFTVRRVHGDWDRSDVTPRSPELIFLASRP